MRLDRFDALSFDCYGTLIDWEAGILEAAHPLLEVPGARAVPDRELLETFGRLEAEAERGAFRRYREVLADVARGLGAAAGAEVSDDRAAAFAASVADWPPFADSPGALRALGSRYRLAVVSNVDDDLFAASARRLGARFDEVVTAEQVGSYKPAAPHFEKLLGRLGLPKERVLHVAQSLFHDIAPASRLGFATVWVNRRARREGGGATPPAEARPDLEVPDLATLAKLAVGAGG